MRHETFGWSQVPIAIGSVACITYACRVGALNARGQKTFLLNPYRYIDTQAAGQANGMGRGVHGPDERVRQLAEAI